MSQLDFLWVKQILKSSKVKLCLAKKSSKMIRS